MGFILVIMVDMTPNINISASFFVFDKCKFVLDLTITSVSLRQEINESIPENIYDVAISVLHWKNVIYIFCTERCSMFLPTASKKVIYSYLSVDYNLWCTMKYPHHIFYHSEIQKVIILSYKKVWITDHCVSTF